MMVFASKTVQYPASFCWGKRFQQVRSCGRDTQLLLLSRSFRWLPSPTNGDSYPSRGNIADDCVGWRRMTNAVAIYEGAISSVPGPRDSRRAILAGLYGKAVTHSLGSLPG